MKSLKERLAEIQADDPSKRFFLHDGYNGWCYGTPQDPVLISNDDGLFLLQYLERSYEGDILEGVQETFPPIEIAQEDSPQRDAARGTRFLVLGHAEDCIVEKPSLIKKEHPIDRSAFGDQTRANKSE